jgi:arachidonate 5-lipoxygenase
MSASSYVVTTRTGTHFGAGTSASIFVTLFGEHGQSAKHKLGGLFRRVFSAGDVDAFTVAGDDLGELYAIELSNESLFIKDDWLVEEVTVTRGARQWRFPMFAWLPGNSTVLTLEGAARTPAKVRGAREAAGRAREISLRREVYTWRPRTPGVDLPGSLDIRADHPLPAAERYRDIADKNYEVTYAETYAEVRLSAPVLAQTWSALTGMAELLKDLGLPRVSDAWSDDLEFARQCVQGIAPVLLQRMTAVPEGMTLTDDDCYGLLEPGVTLARALATARMYLVDLSILEGVPLFCKGTGEGAERRWAPPARAVFFRHGDGHLHPVAIHLGRDPATCPVFTPNDGPLDWLAAKIYFRSAEGNVHQIATHAVRTHFSLEPIIMAAMRNLASAHPLYKLLRRHFRYTLAINEGARQTLLADGGVFDEFIATGGPDKGYLELAQRAWQQWRFVDQRLPDDLRLRGVDDPYALPYYPYRDDALPIWNAISAYVQGILALAYRNDADVAADPELQAFWRDLTENGIPAERFPFAGLTRLHDVVDLARTFIFVASVGHSSVNNLQYEHYGWVPNAPLATHRAPPTRKGEITEAEIRRMMPSLAQSVSQVAIGRALSTFGKDEEFLYQKGGWYRSYFEEPEALAVEARFLQHMREHCERVMVTNEVRPVPYEILSPDRVTCSVTL